MCNNLKELRLNRGLSVSALAKLAELSPSTIRRIERDDTFKVRTDTAGDLATALGLPVTDIFVLSDLSDVGRPPHTGKTCTLKVPTQTPDASPCCNVILLPSGACSLCDEIPPVVRELAAVS